MTIDPGSLKAPYIDAETCKQRADEFRHDFWPSGDYPIDVLAIAEFNLGLEIRPVIGLKDGCDVDALLSIDFQALAVDRDQYLEGRYQNRLRFSIAHELGHYALHRAFAQKLPRTEGELRDFYNTLSDQQYSYLEYQANQFAGALLVPRSELEHRIALFRTGREPLPENEELERVEMIDVLAGYFAVSREVIQIRLSEEGF